MPHPRTLNFWPLVLVLSALLLPNCQRMQEDRKAATELRAAAEAIQSYSRASDTANQAHKAVMDAFDKANRSPSLPEYRTALRTLVLPALDAFVAQLKAMPTGTAQLKTIHAQLVDAYVQARREIDDFEAGLHGADNLGQFADIRSHLQQRVKAYREALANYYAKYQLQLRQEPASATVPPAAVTPTTDGLDPSSLPAAATP